VPLFGGVTTNDGFRLKLTLKSGEVVNVVGLVERGYRVVLVRADDTTVPVYGADASRLCLRSAYSESY